MILMGLAFLIAPVAVQAQTEDLRFERVDKEFHERFGKHGRVSGDIVMGVMIGASDATVSDIRRLADFAPRMTADVAVLRLPEAERVCVRLNSKDGRFEAENTYTIAGAASAPGGAFGYDGEFGSDLAEMSAVSLVKVGSCGDRTEAVIPSLWSGDVAIDDPRSLHVFVNSAGNPTVAVVGSDSDFVPCDDVAEVDTLKYTVGCVIPFALLEAHENDGQVPLTFYISRSLGQEAFDITVILPQDGD